MAVPTLSVRYSTDDADDPTPAWTDVTAYVRAFSTSRGRETELGDVGPGTATITLNNRTRLFDPTSNALLRPMNRWNIRATLPNATTEDIFLGYAEAYEQQWPGVGMDAVTVVNCADEFKVLAQDRLPVTDPPRDTYAEVVQFDNPQGYWNGSLMPNRVSHAPVVGDVEMGVYVGSWTRVAGAIVGDYGLPPLYTSSTATLLASALTGYTASTDPATLLAGLVANGPGDASGLSAMTFETWFQSTEATPAAERQITDGPNKAGVPQYGFRQNTDGTIDAFAVNSGGTVFTATSVTTLSANTWYHLAIVVTGSNTLLYINGVQAATASFSGVLHTMDAGSFLRLGPLTAVGGTRSYDDWAFYRSALPVARILAHYTAGVNRGFANQDPGARITAVLGESTSIAATSIRAGSREMIPAFMAGRPPLDMLRDAENADSVDAVLFIAKNGTVTFLDDGHRSVAPWNAVKATFDDDGTDLPYQEISLDYSDTFIANEWNITKTGGTTVTTSDATSISRYGKRTQALTDLPVTTDADVTSASTALLAKYKDPMTRVTGLGLLASGTATLINTIFTLDIGDRIRVFRSPLGGGTRIDQTLFVQKIAIDGDPSGPWRVRLGVSPL